MEKQNFKIREMEAFIAPIRQNIVQHPLYRSIQDLNELHPFMEHHIFAVWDFMSLLKALQNELTCTKLPWMPVGDAETRYLINEIVVGEESDEMPDGRRLSHFELYLEAMQQSKADTSSIENFLEALRAGNSVDTALQLINAPEGVRRFVEFTFEVANSGKPYIMAAVFTFGREDLIPDMFRSMVDNLNLKFPKALTIFKYYLDRHIEVDGDHHSHLALSMTARLCGDNPYRWAEAKAAVLKALEMRKMLWDSALAAVNRTKFALME